MKLFAQIAAVAGALSMLVGFVVYSQQKAGLAIGYLKARQAETSTNMPGKSAHPPAVAPGSKRLAPLVPLAAPKAIPPLPATLGPNSSVAPSSKSRAPLISSQAPTVPTNSSKELPEAPVQRGGPASDIVAFSSKSGILITPAHFAPDPFTLVLTPVPPQPAAIFSSAPAQHVMSAQQMYSTKYAPFVAPTNFITYVQGWARQRTNSTPAKTSP